MADEKDSKVNDDMENVDKTEGAAEAAPEGDLIDEAEKVVAEAAETIEGELDTDALAAAAAEALKKAQAEVADWKDKYLRLHAEWDTYRRRTNENRANEKALATEKLVGDIIPVLDDFERTITYAEQNGEQGLLDGVKAVQTKLHQLLEKNGLEQLDPKGEAFDALEHQAVATVPDEEAFDETVHDVYQKGYRMGKKVLRPAMVTVTTGGPKRPKDDESADGDENKE